MLVARRILSTTTTKPPPSAAKQLQLGMDALMNLEQASMTRRQAESLVRVMSELIEETNSRQRELVASTADVQSLRAELSEKVFNATLKFDVSQRHLREILERDVGNLRADLRAEERQNYTNLLEQLAAIEKAALRKEMADERRFESIKSEQAHLETRFLQYIFGGIVGGGATVATIGLAIARLIM